MELGLDSNIIYRLIESAIADFGKAKDENTQYSGSYSVNDEYKMAFKKYSMDAKGELQYLNVGITKNRSQLYVEYKGGYMTQRACVSRPWIFGRKEHNKLLKGVRQIVWELKNQDMLRQQARDRANFLNGVRSMVPGALESLAENILFEDKDQ